MKKLFLTLALVATAAMSYGQGTIAFVNGTLSRHQYEATAGGARVNVPIDLPLVFGLFVGESAGSLSLVPVQPLAGMSTSATGQGIMGGVPALYVVPGFDTGSRPFAQIRAWDASFGNDWQAAMTQGRYFGQTDVRQLSALGAASGPATVIWQSATATNPERFNPIIVRPVPEPSTIALGVIGIGALWMLRRRQAK